MKKIWKINFRMLRSWKWWADAFMKEFKILLDSSNFQLVFSSFKLFSKFIYFIQVFHIILFLWTKWIFWDLKLSHNIRQNDHTTFLNFQIYGAIFSIFSTLQISVNMCPVWQQCSVLQFWILLLHHKNLFYLNISSAGHQVWISKYQSDTAILSFADNLLFQSCLLLQMCVYTVEWVLNTIIHHFCEIKKTENLLNH